jgi:FkbM family methyltransferase
MLSTRKKIQLAAALSKGLLFARRLCGLPSDSVKASRKGLIWELNLTEGIDLAIYLSVFERSTYVALQSLIKPGDVVLDIGANIGAHTLPLAQSVGDSGKVYAFEPTDFAFSKLLRNIQLNPGIISRIVAVQAFLGERDDAIPDDDVYSGWPLSFDGPVHEKHLGRAESLGGAKPIVLDDFIRTRELKRVDAVKMDVDGFECHVLGGARELLHKYRPQLIMELAPYVLTERGRSLDELVSLLRDAGYGLFRLEDEAALPSDTGQLNELVPSGASMNILARPD